MAEEDFYWLALNLIPGVGAILFKRLFDRFKTPEAVFHASLADLLQIEGVGERTAKEILRGPRDEAVRTEWDRLKEVGGNIITLKDENYPGNLKNTYDPPPVLYCRGALKREDELAVSVVGSRKTSSYGRWITERMSRELAGEGITIVSGMARGIDSIAHLGAISGGGRTIAVLGCGVDVVYPPENRNLFREIVDHGAVVSEFPMSSAPEAAHFPRRNRIISGLSLGVLVVEATSKSGSLITAGYALDQGREVFAIPGNVGTTGSQGVNRLIKEGAKLVESSEDILEEVLPRRTRGKKKIEEASRPGKDLPEGERILYELLGETPLHIDLIIRESHLDAGRVSSLLLTLELKGLICQWPGKCFGRKV